MALASDTALSKKRQFAEERAARLRDPRVRCLGIDKVALDEQVKERKAMEQLEKDRDGFFDQQRLLMDKHAMVMQREVQQVRAARDKELEDYRSTYQKRDMRREWDLNDPKRVVGALPPRIGDTDPRTGASSLQKFEGEDLDLGERRRLQAEQQRKWCQAQQDEKLMKKWMEKDLQRQYEDRAEETAHRTWQVEQEIGKQRRQMSQTTAEFNRAMAEQKRQEKLKGKIDTTQKNLEEISNMLNDDCLGETTATSFTARADFKGMTNEQRAGIVAEQARQREQLRQRRLQEAEDSRVSDVQEQLQVRMAMQLDRARQRERRDELTKLGEQRKTQAEEAKQRKKELDETYANAIGEEYFVYGKCL